MTEKEIEEGIFRYQNQSEVLKDSTFVFLRNVKEMPQFESVAVNENEKIGFSRYFELDEAANGKLVLNSDRNQRLERMKQRLRDIYSTDQLKSNLIEYNEVKLNYFFVLID